MVGCARHLIRLTCTSFIWTQAYLADAAPRFSQMVLPFASERTFNYSYDPSENAISLEILGTSAVELEALEQYDERVIRRVLVKDLGANGVQVTFALKDRMLRSSVAHFSDPFRIVLDFFDYDYVEDRDPVTGMPLVAAQKHGTSESFDVQSANQGQMPLAVRPPLESTPSIDNARVASHQLMRPGADVMHGPDQLVEALEKAQAGPGKHWAEYPFYIYRIQTAVYENERGRSEWLRANAGKALSSAAAMADYAGRLYDFGHDYRAVLAYQQVLYRDASIFDKDPLHLWRLADGHFGQGNLTLADGYFQTLIEKHPDSQLSRFARLRRLDVQAIRAYQQGKVEQLAALAAPLRQVPAGDNMELRAQVALRSAYWRGLSANDVAKVKADKSAIPELTADQVNELTTARDSVESSKTAFLTNTFLLHDRLSAAKPWQSETGLAAADYFERFKGPATTPFRETLRDMLKQKLDGQIQGLVDQKQHLAAINAYNELPAALQSVRKTPQTSWALAEAHRALGQDAQSIPFYEIASESFSEKKKQFLANFRLATVSSTVLRDRKGEDAGGKLSKSAANADRAMAAIWRDLDAAERRAILAENKEDLERAAVGAGKLSSPAQIVLDAWSEALKNQSIQKSETGSASETAFVANSNTVKLFNDLTKRFAELGDQNRRRQTAGLLRHLKPAQLDDNEAKQIWARELVALADEYRQSSEFLEAGRIYAYTGSESENWAGRAEALYKGGLLLYRAGQREEAMEAFRKASEDGNNQFYANLAKERINRLEE